MIDLPQRFWDKVKYSPGCWLWTAAKASGYGRFRLNGGLQGTHRLTLAWALGRPLLSSEYALHSCHNPSCVNPDHLRVGTHQDNMNDRDSAGRQARIQGKANGQAKLTKGDVFAIRALLHEGNLYQREIGDLFGVSNSTVGRIKSGENWSHTEGEKA